ncbi:MAG: DUF4349 domain-containing protein, partial [Bacteroidota bacterium]
MRLFLIAFALTFIALVSTGTGCATGSSDSGAPAFAEDRMAVDATGAMPVSEAELRQSPAPQIERQLIKTGRLSMRVGDYDDAVAALRDTIANYDAYLSGEQEQRRTYRVENTFVVRVAS